MSINISGIDKVDLLQALHARQVPAGFFGGFSGPSFDKEKAKEAVKQYIDYFCGRAIKTDVSKDTVDPWLYDRDAGQGAFQSVVDSLKK